MYDLYDRRVLIDFFCFVVMGFMYFLGLMRMMGLFLGGILGVVFLGFNLMMGLGG